MINSEPLSIMNQMISNRVPQNYYSSQQQPPTTSRLTLENQYNQLANQMLQQPHPQSDPYTDYLSILQSCTEITRDKIMQDERYIQIYMHCENAIKQTLYAQIIPSLVQTQQGRMLFEQLQATTQSLKDEYTQLDIKRERESAELEKRLMEREARLVEKEKQIDEMLKKANTTPPPQSHSAQKSSIHLLSETGDKE